MSFQLASQSEVVECMRYVQHCTQAFGTQQVNRVPPRKTLHGLSFPCNIKINTSLKWLPRPLLTFQHATQPLALLNLATPTSFCPLSCHRTAIQEGNWVGSGENVDRRGGARGEGMILNGRVRLMEQSNGEMWVGVRSTD